jgi:hypothetical protein
MTDPINDLKKELLAAAERQQQQARSSGDRRPWLSLGRNRLALTAATVAVVAVAALLFTTPWSSSPGFLDRAEAALTPSPGSVLYMKWETTRTTAEASCVATFDIWIDQASPHSYRVLGANDCVSGPPVESGGTIGGRAFMFEPPGRLKPIYGGYTGPQNPVAWLRAAIRKGRARDEGKRQLAGRTVARIRVDDPSLCRPPSNVCGPVNFLVDPQTFRPVQVEAPAVVDSSGKRVRDVVRYQEYDYLPRTQANRVLADIRAQHPNAKER